MAEISGFLLGAIELGLAVLVGLVGLLFLSLPRGGENEIARTIGAAILFVCFMGILGLLLMRNYSLADARPAPQPIAGSHH